MDDAPAGVRRGEELERLYREKGGRMWRAVLAFSGDPEVASDAVAEAFAQALRRGEAIRDAERWLWRAAFRIASGALKDRRMTVALGRRTEDVYEMEDLAHDLLVALRSLSRMQRGSVVLHHIAGYPTREIAAILGSTNAAVRVHLVRGRRRLRELLTEGDGDA